MCKPYSVFDASTVFLTVQALRWQVNAGIRCETDAERSGPGAAQIYRGRISAHHLGNVCQTLNVIFIHETGTLFHVCVDPGVVPEGLSVRPLCPSLWMERFLSIFSELRVGEPLCAD